MSTETSLKLEPYVSSSSSSDDEEENDDKFSQDIAKPLNKINQCFDITRLICDRKLKPLLLLMNEKIIPVNIIVNLSNKFTLLHFACYYNKENAVRMLVEKLGADINIKDISNQTPLHLAVRYSFNSIVYTIAQRPDCRIEELDCEHCTPLLCSVKHSLLYCFLYFYFEKNSDCKVLDNNGCSISHWAAYKNNVQMLSLFKSLDLLEIDLKDLAGQSPIFRAIQNRSTQAVKYLLKENANIDITNNDSQTPSTYAKDQKKNIELYNLIEQERANRYLSKHGLCNLYSYMKESKKKIGCKNAISLYIKKLYERVSASLFWINVLYYQVILFISLFYSTNSASRITCAIFIMFISVLSKLALWRLYSTEAGYKKKMKANDSSNMLPMLIERLREDYSLESDLCTYCLNVNCINDNHCKKCNRCVKGFALHCGCMNKCIGEHNARYYYGYCIFSILEHGLAAYIFITSLFYLVDTSYNAIMPRLIIHLLYNHPVYLYIHISLMSRSIYYTGVFLKILAAFARDTTIYNITHLYKKREFCHSIEACKRNNLALNNYSWKSCIVNIIKGVLSTLRVNLTSTQTSQYKDITTSA